MPSPMQQNRDAPPADAIRAVLHRAPDPAGVRRRLRGASFGRLGDPASPAPGLAARRGGAAAHPPDPRPRYQVRAFLRHDVPGRRRACRADPGPSTASECDCRALGGDGPPGMPRLAAHPRTTALGASLEGIRRALQHGSSAPRTRVTGSPPGQRVVSIRSSVAIGWEGSSTSTSHSPPDATTAQLGFLHHACSGGLGGRGRK